MGLSTGTRFGPYEIVAPLGAGGMGEVYRARDTRLERTVAIKVLNSSLVASPSLKSRFEREAKTISQLSHPNICTLYDVGHEDGTDYLVMEFLQGESLAERLKRGPLPLKELVAIGCDIADALERAHRAGVVHRDLKPGNVMLTRTGAKLLDFGLAKPAAMSAAAGGPSAPLLSAAMTLTSPTPQQSPLTQQGALVGTVQYMSPEQIQGLEADTRSDIFALGAMLYEMATGKRAFDGKSQIKVASAILEDEPQSVSAVMKTSPPALDRLVRTCLAKSPDERFQSALDLKLELKWLSMEPAGIAPTPAKFAWWTTYAALAALAIIALVLLWTRSSWPTQRMMQFTAALPYSARSMAVAPDGRTAALVSYREDTHRVGLFLYEIGANDAKPLAGTEGASFPFWSPDGRAIGFFANGKLKRFDLDSASVRTLCDAPSGRGGSWSKRGVILFTPRGTLNEGIDSVSDSGGVPIKFNYPGATGSENSYRWPVFLPDGKHYLFLAANIRGDIELNNNLYIGSIDNQSEKHLLTRTVYNGDYANGYVFFVRDGAVQAQKLDLGSYKLTGDVLRIFDKVKQQSRIMYAAYAAGADIVLAQEAGEVSLSRLTWYDRSGKMISNSAPPDTYGNLAIAADGTYVATDKTDTTNENTDIFIYDLARASLRRLTFDPGIDAVPVWSPDRRSIAFTSSRGRNFGVFVKPADGSQPERELPLTTGIDALPLDWSRDGQLLYLAPPDLWVYSFLDGKARLFLKATSSLKNAQFSPNGKWVAYASNESGRWEVYVTSFPDANGKWQVSTDGGEQPRWRGDGKEIYFLSSDVKLMAVSVDTEHEFQSGTPRVLFQTDPREQVATTEQVVYDVSRDGQRFLVNSKYNNGSAHPMSVILNWNLR